MTLIKVPIEVVGADGVRTKKMEALVDPANTFAMIPASVLQDLGLSAIECSRFTLPNGNFRELGTCETRIRVQGVERTTMIIFGSEGEKPRLGSYTLTGLGLAVDPMTRKLVEATLRA